MAIVKGESYSVGGRIDRYTLNPRATPTIVFNKRKRQRKSRKRRRKRIFRCRHWRAKGKQNHNERADPLRSGLYTGAEWKISFFIFFFFSLCHQTTISLKRKFEFLLSAQTAPFLFNLFQQLYKSHTTTGCKFESLSGGQSAKFYKNRSTRVVSSSQL